MAFDRLTELCGHSLGSQTARRRCETQCSSCARAENDRAALQASQAESEAKLKKLTTQVEGSTKQAAVAEKASTDQEAQLAKFKEAVQKWEAAYKQAVEIANAKETARAKLAE